jgi:choline dehydrogenase-like flavoprotein
MAKKLPPKDAVIIGLGWTGSILAHELCEAGLSVAAIERGPWRDPTAEFTPTMAQDELRFRIRHDLFLRPAQTSVTFRNNAGQTALPVRNWGAFMLGNGGRRRRTALECGDVALSAERFRRQVPPDPTLRRKVSPRGHDDPGLGRHL